MKKYFPTIILISALSFISIFSQTHLVWGWNAPNGNPPSGTTNENLFVSDGKFGVGISSNLVSKFTVAGVIETTSGGIKFPDGTTQITAASASDVYASNIYSGQFGSNVGGGNFSFPANVGIGITGPEAKLHVYETAGLGGALGDSKILSRIAGVTNNIFMENTWLYRDAVGTSWYTARLHNGVSIDSSYLTPGTNTRTWWERDPYNNIQSWGTSSSTYMTIIDGGNVGIGTTGPGHKLDIRGSATDVAQQIGLGVNSARHWVLSANAYNTGKNKYDFEVTSPDYAGDLLINNNGNVGIGTTSPAQKLSVAGTVESTSGGFKFPDGSTQSTASGSSQWTSSSTSIYYNSGNVGIGTASPGGKLSVMDTNGGFFFAADASYNRFKSVATSIGVGRDLLLATNDGGNSGLYIKSTGNVGIGTTSPTYNLHVVGNIYADLGWLRTSGTTGWYNETYGGGWYMSDSTWIRSYNNRSIYHNSGTMRTDGTFQVGSSGGTLNVVNDGNMSYRTNVLFANTAGNVGVGTASPQYKLDVSGDVRATDKIITSRYGHAGTYDSTQVQGIWSIGDGFQIDTTNNNFGSQYGLVYAHTNAGSGATNQAIANWGHQILFTNNGIRNAAVSLTSGHGYFAGNVGIGTTSPAQKLSVAGTVESTSGGFKFPDGTTQTSAAGTGSQWTTSSTVIYYNSGNVGIGTASPQSKLSVGGNGSSDYGIYSAGSTTGVYSAGSSYGVYSTGSNYGILSVSSNAGSYGVYGIGGGVGSYGVYGSGSTGVYGVGGFGVYGVGNNVGKSGVYGVSTYDSSYGVYGISNNMSGYGIYCSSVNTSGCAGNRAWYNASDERLKENILTIDNALGKVLQLRGVEYNWINDKEKTPQIGFIAQETLPVIPEVVGKDMDGYYSMSYGSMTPLLVEAIKEQQKQIEDLKAEIEIIKVNKR